MVRPIDVSQVVNSLQYLGQSRQRLADIEREEKRRKSSTGAQLGGIAGGVIGGIYGGPVGGAAGGAIGSYAGGRLAGGNADSSQVASSGMQGYQMGQQQQQQQQQEQQVERNKAQSLKMKQYYSRPEATPQQQSFAATIPEEGSQRPAGELLKEWSYAQSLEGTKPFTSAQYKEKFGRDAPIGYDMQQKPDGTIIYQKIDTTQADPSIKLMAGDALKRLRNEFSDLVKPEYVSSDVKKAKAEEVYSDVDSDVSMADADLASKNLKKEAVAAAKREEEFANKFSQIQTIYNAKNITPERAEKELNRIIPVPKEKEEVTYVEDGGKWNKVTSKGGETIKKEVVSADQVPTNETPVPLKIATESAISIITNSIDGEPTPAQQKDINLISQLAKSRAKDQTQAISQVEKIQKKYDKTGDNVTKDFWAVNEEGKAVSLGYTTFNDAKENAPKGFTVTATQPKDDVLVKDYFAVNKDGDYKFLGNISRKEAVDEIKVKYPEYTLTSTAPKQQGEGATKDERAIKFMNDTYEKIKAGTPVPEEDLMRYTTAWLDTRDKTVVTDAQNNKSIVSQSGYLKPQEIRRLNSQISPQQDSPRIADQPAPQGGQQPAAQQPSAINQQQPLPQFIVDQAGPQMGVQQQPQVSVISATQRGTPVSDPYSTIDQVGERPWQKTSMDDFKTIQSLGQYDTALKVMSATSDDMSWFNKAKFASFGLLGDGFAKSTAKNVPQEVLDQFGIKPGAKKFVAAYTNQVLAMQQMVKGNPSDRDIGFMLESTAAPTNDPEYNKQVIAYNREQIKSALKLKFEIMASEKKMLTPEMVEVATNAGIDLKEVERSVLDKKSRGINVRESGENEMRRKHAIMASMAGKNYRPKEMFSYEEIVNGKKVEKTVFNQPAKHLLSSDNKLFSGVNYTPQMAKVITEDKEILYALSKEDLEKLTKIFRGQQNGV